MMLLFYRVNQFGKDSSLWTLSDEVVLLQSVNITLLLKQVLIATLRVALSSGSKCGDLCLDRR